jgi:hypothetical protein
VIDHGVTGYICEDIDDAVCALQRIDELPRTEIRAQFERRFSAKAKAMAMAMAQQYVDVYSTLLPRAVHPALQRAVAR